MNRLYDVSAAIAQKLRRSHKIHLTLPIPTPWTFDVNNVICPKISSYLYWRLSKISKGLNEGVNNQAIQNNQNNQKKVAQSNELILFTICCQALESTLLQSYGRDAWRLGEGTEGAEGSKVFLIAHYKTELRITDFWFAVILATFHFET